MDVKGGTVVAQWDYECGKISEEGKIVLGWAG